ncbi:hypothetical protein JCM11641_002365 [Rhodosporidiobolus odoratus]
MTSLKRHKSLTDFFRPTRSSSTRDPASSTSSNRNNPAARPASPTSASYAADYSSAGPRDPLGHGRPRPSVNTTTSTMPTSRSAELDDILGAYGDSPTKTRFPPQPQRSDTKFSTYTADSTDQMDDMPTLSHRNVDPLKTSTRSNGSSASPANAPRSKSNGELDLIDRLDISGLYGGGGFIRHDGPYAAASTSRNQGSHAPIDAFDPSAFSLAGPSRASRAPSSSATPSSSSIPRRKGSNGVSERAQATLAAMDSVGGRGDGPYGAARDAAKQEVSMGFPGQSSNKSAQLMEIYGYRDAEAWEDYGAARYDPASAAQSRDSIVPPGTSKEDRINRTQSIWDIEATLRAGKPVGSAPPPVPVIPSEWSAPETTPSSKPKRSKSLAARFRAGRRNPNNPLTDENYGGADDGREAGQARSVPVSPVEDRRGARELPLVNSMSPSNGSASHISTTGNDVDRLGERTAAIKFDSSADRDCSLGMSRSASVPGDEEKKKGGGGLKRLFSTKRKA